MWRCGEVCVEVWGGLCGEVEGGGEVCVEVWRCGGVEAWRCGGVEVWRCGGVEVCTVQVLSDFSHSN